MTNKVYGLPCSICPSSDAVTKYPDGWKKCYSCDKWTPPKESMSGKCVQISDNSFEFPGDYSTDIPIEYHNWFTQYGLSVDDVHCYKFGYSMKVKRIIIPLDDNKKKWIGRRVYNWQSKYITPTGQSYAPFKAYGDGYNLILVEDCLSAIKVSLATNLGPSWALLGVGNRKIGGMVRKLNPKKVYIWMDGGREIGRASCRERV